MNNQDGNNVANANGEVNPLNLNDNQLIEFLAQYHSEHGYVAMNRNLYEDPTNLQACEQMKARVGSLSRRQLADYVVRILERNNTNINAVRQFATEQAGGAVSLALGLGNDTIMGNNRLRNKLNGALSLPLVVDFNATGVAATAVEQPPQQPPPMNYNVGHQAPPPAPFNTNPLPPQQPPSMNYIPQVDDNFSFAGNVDAAAAQQQQAAAAHRPMPSFEGFGNVTNAPFTTPARSHQGLRQPPFTPGSTYQPSFAPQAGGIFSTPSVSRMNVRGQGYSAGGGSQYKPFSSYSQEENIHPNGSHWGGDAASIGSLTNSLRSSRISSRTLDLGKLTSEDITTKAPLSDLNNKVKSHVSFPDVVQKIRNGDEEVCFDLKAEVEAAKQNMSRLNFDNLVKDQVTSSEEDEKSAKSHIESILEAAENIPTKTGLHFTRIQAEAAAEIRAVQAKLEKDLSECIQNAKSELTDLEAQVESCSKELTRLEESKKERLTVVVAIRKALDIGYRVLSYHFSFRKNGGKCDEETMQEHQKLESELKALQVGIANNDVESLKPLVWKESVPAVVDFASIWGKLSKVENDSKEPSGTNHY